MMKTILVIEDNCDMRENISEYFETVEYTVITADNGEDGVKLARTHLPDIILCDIRMPAMSGLEVLQHICEQKDTCKIPFIFSSAQAEKADRDNALEMGADDYIVKPYDMETLHSLTEKWICRGSKRSN